MFENFSFDSPSPRRHSILPADEGPFSPCTISDADIPPYFSSKDQLTPPPSPPTFKYSSFNNYSLDSANRDRSYLADSCDEDEPDNLPYNRKPSIASVFENLYIRDRSSLRQLSPPPSVSDAGFSRDDVRRQRQMLSELHCDDAQRQSLAELVEEMIASGQIGALFSNNELSSRKSWTNGGVVCDRARVQKKSSKSRKSSVNGREKSIRCRK